MRKFNGLLIALATASYMSILDTEAETTGSGASGNAAPPKEKDPNAPSDVSVSRNGVSLVFKSCQIARGDREGTYYLAPEITVDNLNDALAWIGAKDVVGIVAPKMRQKSQGWYNESVDDQGVFHSDEFAQYAADYSARGESIKDLINENQELVEQLEVAVEAENMVKAAEITKKLKANRLAIKSKKRMTKEDKEAKEKAEQEEAAKVNA